MGMDWKDNTVSMGLVDKEEFDTKLARITVSENRVAVEPKGVDDWERIFEELGADTVLEDVYWDEVENVTVTIRDLYYPHINIQVKRQPQEGERDLSLHRERRIYFTEDEKNTLQDCFSAIKKYWYKWRQSNTRNDDRFDVDDEPPAEEVELDAALREQAQQHREQDAETQDGQEKQQGREEQGEQKRAADTEEDDDTTGDGDSGSDQDAGDTADEAGEGDSDDGHTEDDEIDAVVNRFMEDD